MIGTKNQSAQDLEDLTQAMGNRPLLCTDPVNWLNRIVALRGPYKYLYILGDTTELASSQDDAYIDEFLKWLFLCLSQR
jgi:hypothetical protein